MSVIGQIVEKLKSPAAEVQTRAFKSLQMKLKCKIVSREEAAINLPLHVALLEWLNSPECLRREVLELLVDFSKIQDSLHILLKIGGVSFLTAFQGDPDNEPLYYLVERLLQSLLSLPSHPEPFQTHNFTYESFDATPATHSRLDFVPEPSATNHGSGSFSTLHSGFSTARMSPASVVVAGPFGWFFPIPLINPEDQRILLQICARLKSIEPAEIEVGIHHLCQALLDFPFEALLSPHCSLIEAITHLLSNLSNASQSCVNAIGTVISSITQSFHSTMNLYSDSKTFERNPGDDAWLYPSYLKPETSNRSPGDGYSSISSTALCIKWTLALLSNPSSRITNHLYNSSKQLLDFFPVGLEWSPDVERLYEEFMRHSAHVTVDLKYTSENYGIINLGVAICARILEMNPPRNILDSIINFIQPLYISFEFESLSPRDHNVVKEIIKDKCPDLFKEFSQLKGCIRSFDSYQKIIPNLPKISDIELLQLIKESVASLLFEAQPFQPLIDMFFSAVSSSAPSEQNLALACDVICELICHSSSFIREYALVAMRKTAAQKLSRLFRLMCSESRVASVIFGFSIHNDKKLTLEFLLAIHQHDSAFSSTLKTYVALLQPYILETGTGPKIFSLTDNLYQKHSVDYLALSLRYLYHREERVRLYGVKLLKQYTGSGNKSMEVLLKDTTTVRELTKDISPALVMISQQTNKSKQWDFLRTKDLLISSKVDNSMRLPLLNNILFLLKGKGSISMDYFDAPLLTALIHGFKFEIQIQDDQNYRFIAVCLEVLIWWTLVKPDSASMIFNHDNIVDFCIGVLHHEPDIRSNSLQLLSRWVFDSAVSFPFESLPCHLDFSMDSTPKEKSIHHIKVAMPIAVSFHIPTPFVTMTTKGSIEGSSQALSLKSQLYIHSIIDSITTTNEDEHANHFLMSIVAEYTKGFELSGSSVDVGPLYDKLSYDLSHCPELGKYLNQSGFTRNLRRSLETPGHTSTFHRHVFPFLQFVSAWVKSEKKHPVDSHLLSTVVSLAIGSMLDTFFKNFRELNSQLVDAFYHFLTELSDYSSIDLIPERFRSKVMTLTYQVTQASLTNSNLSSHADVYRFLFYYSMNYRVFLNPHEVHGLLDLLKGLLCNICQHISTKGFFGKGKVRLILGSVETINSIVLSESDSSAKRYIEKIVFDACLLDRDLILRSLSCKVLGRLITNPQDWIEQVAKDVVSEEVISYYREGSLEFIHGCCVKDRYLLGFAMHRVFLIGGSLVTRMKHSRHSSSYFVSLSSLLVLSVQARRPELSVEDFPWQDFVNLLDYQTCRKLFADETNPRIRGKLSKSPDLNVLDDNAAIHKGRLHILHALIQYLTTNDHLQVMFVECMHLHARLLAILFEKLPMDYPPEQKQVRDRERDSLQSTQKATLLLLHTLLNDNRGTFMAMLGEGREDESIIPILSILGSHLSDKFSTEHRVFCSRLLNTFLGFISERASLIELMHVQDDVLEAVQPLSQKLMEDLLDLVDQSGWKKKVICPQELFPWSVLSALSNLILHSRHAKLSILSGTFVRDCTNRLVQVFDVMKKQQSEPQNKKKGTMLIHQDFSMIVQILKNLFHRNESNEISTEIQDVVRILKAEWKFISGQKTIYVPCLQLICTITSCKDGIKPIIADFVIGNASLLHLLMTSIAQMRAYDEKTFSVILRTLTNLCVFKETVASFNKIGVADTLMVHLQSAFEERLWMKSIYILQCLAALSFDVDGAILIGRVSGSLKVFLSLVNHGDGIASSLSMLIMRNIAFTDESKMYYTSHDGTLNDVVMCLRHLSSDVKHYCSSLLWALVYNNQKAKSILKNPILKEKIKRAEVLIYQELCVMNPSAIESIPARVPILQLKQAKRIQSASFSNDSSTPDPTKMMHLTKAADCMDNLLLLLDD